MYSSFIYISKLFTLYTLYILHITGKSKSILFHRYPYLSQDRSQLSDAVWPVRDVSPSAFPLVGDPLRHWPTIPDPDECCPMPPIDIDIYCYMLAIAESMKGNRAKNSLRIWDLFIYTIFCIVYEFIIT